MSVTSQYQFLLGFFNGPFIDINTVSNNNQPFSESLNGNILTVHRSSTEILVELGSKINTAANVASVSQKLTSAGASLTSQIGIQGVIWAAVPYFFQNPAAHKFTDMLIRIHFDFHIATPWYCSDADGTISVFLFLFLDQAGHLHVTLDGLWFHFDGGGPFCKSAIKDGLLSAMPSVKAAVQGILPALIMPAAGKKFSFLYFLPGNGTKAPGVSVQDATSDLAIGLLS